MILAGDVGATKILLEAGDLRSGRWESRLERRYAIADYDNFGAVLERFLEEWDAVKPPRARITAAGVGAAGPALGNKVKMTHRPWILDGDALARRFAIPRFRVVNDMAAAAFGVELLQSRDFLTVQAGRAVPDAPRVVMGLGTGLGVAYLTPRGGRLDVVPGEAGHVGFSPGSAMQWALWRSLFEAHGRVEAEDVISGRGLSNVYEHLRRDAQTTAAVERADPAWISDGALRRGDETCQSALDLMVECLGNVAGDQALALMARGGVYFTGGVGAKIARSIKSPRFCAAFCAKGALSSILMKIPVKVATSERVAVLGAARWALEG